MNKNINELNNESEVNVSNVNNICKKMLKVNECVQAYAHHNIKCTCSGTMCIYDINSLWSQGKFDVGFIQLQPLDTEHYKRRCLGGYN